MMAGMRKLDLRLESADLAEVVRLVGISEDCFHPVGVRFLLRKRFGDVFSGGFQHAQKLAYVADFRREFCGQQSDRGLWSLFRHGGFGLVGCGLK